MEGEERAGGWVSNGHRRVGVREGELFRVR